MQYKIDWWFIIVSGFGCTFPMFWTCRYKVVSQSTYATRIRTCDQSSSAACFDQHSDEKPKVEMKTKSNCAPDGSVTAFGSRIVIIICWYSIGICLNYIILYYIILYYIILYYIILYYIIFCKQLLSFLCSLFIP